MSFFPSEGKALSSAPLLAALSTLKKQKTKKTQNSNDAPPAVRHQVDPLRRVLREHDLPVARGVNEAPHLRPRVFVARRRPRGELVDAAVHVRVVPLVVRVHGFEDGDGLLRRRAVVEIDEIAAALELLVEDGEVGTDAGREERGRRGGGGGGRGWGRGRRRLFFFFFRRWKVRSSSFVIVEGELVSSFIYVDGVYAMSRIGLYASAGEERRGRGVGGSDHSMAEA